MIAEDIEDIVLECEVSNVAALSLYDNLGFVRDKRLNRCDLPPLIPLAETDPCCSLGFNTIDTASGSCDSQASCSASMSCSTVVQPLPLCSPVSHTALCQGFRVVLVRVVKAYKRT